MERYTDREALELYRVALQNNDVFDGHYVPTLSRLFGEEEWAAMKQVWRSQKSLANEILRRVREKDKLKFYLEFTEALFECESVRPLAAQSMPFVSNFYARPVAVAPIWLPCSEGTLLVWVVTSKDDHRLASERLRKSGFIPKGRPHRIPVINLSYQLLDSSTAAICLTLAEGAAVFTVSSFLRSLHPSPSLSLLTGTCSAPLSLAAGGDVVLVGRSKAVSALPAQLQHSTALDVWRLGRRERYSQPTAEKSEFEQVLWLTRLHAELQNAPDKRSRWFRELQLGESRPVWETAAFRQHIPHPDRLWNRLKTNRAWQPSPDGHPLPFSPTGHLHALGRASISFAPSSFPTRPPHTHPRLLTSYGANRFLVGGASVVCSPEATSFYLKTNIESIAVMAVSHVSVDGAEYACGGSEVSCNAVAFSCHALLLHSGQLEPGGGAAD